ncbi:MAG: methionine--tRNA ligase subunit beta, partial [Natronospirillum sp.]
TSIAAQFEAREYSKAIRQIMNLADRANEYIQENAPWVLAKQAGKEADVLAICTQSLNLFRVLMTYLQPVLPSMGEKAAEFLAIEDFAWSGIQQPLLGHTINKFKPLMTRLEMDHVEAMVDASKVTDEAKAAAKAKANDPTQQRPAAKRVEKRPPTPSEAPSTIDFADFAKLDLRVAQVVAADHVEGADKLLKLTLEVGDGERRQVFSGIKSHYQPSDLQGKNVVLVYNLAPRKMRFGISEGMVLAAGEGDALWVLEPNAEIPPGTKIS